MAIKFYLYSTDTNNGGLEIHCNTNSTITEIAGTFDLGTMELEWNECKYAIFPNTLFFIEETETNEIWNFIIVEDNVEVVKKTNTIKYFHKLTLSQSIHKLNNVPLRNTVFTQPRDYQKRFVKKTLFAVGCKYNQYGYFLSYDSSINVNHEYNTDNFLKTNYRFSFSNIDKLSDVVIKISAIVMGYSDFAIETGGNDIDMQTITQRGSALLSSFTFQVVNANNTSDYLEFTLYAPIRDVVFTQAQMNWLKGKDVYIKVISSAIAAISTYMPSSITRTDGSEEDITLPFVSGLITFEMEANTYNYSLWDVLDIINKQCKKRFNGVSYDDFYIMPNKLTGQGLELDSIIAPEFNFTQTDLYEAVAKVMSFIDAFPVLDENGVLGFQYLNNLSEDTIEDLKIGDVKTTLNEENFTNRLATYYQNGKLNFPISYPAKNFFKYPTTSKFGVPDLNDWYFVVDKPIDFIDKFTILMNISDIQLPQVFFYSGFLYSHSTGKYVNFLNFMPSTSLSVSEPVDVDISSSIFPIDVYNHLPSGSASERTTNKNNSLYYERGDNKIYAGITGKIFGNNTEGEVLEYVIRNAVSYNLGFYHAGISFSYSLGDKKNYRFNCVYYPILDGKVAQESTINKAEKETVVAQANSGTELNRLGNNLQGLIAKLGNEEKSITLPITELKNRVKLGTKFIDELGNNWFANRIQTTFTTDKEKVIVNATFTKNYNAMQQFTSLNQEKRFYEISAEITTKGYENLNEFLYFTNNKNLNVSNFATKTSWLKAGLQAILNKTFGYKGNDYELENKISVFNNVSVQSIGNENVYTYSPPAVYGCGNQICFELGFKEPLLAAKVSTTETYAWLYTSDNGVANSFTITANFLDSSTWYYTRYYPQITDTLPGTQFFKLYHINYYKKPNEIFHLNYSLNFLPYWTKTTENDLNIPQYSYEEIFFGDKFVNENGIIPNTIYDLGKPRKIHLFVGNEKYSIIDNKVPNSATDIGEVEVRISQTVKDTDSNTGTSIYGSIEVYYQSTICDVSSYNSWCIADDEGNIYIAVNRNENSFSTAKLNFFTSRFRKV